MGCRLKEKKSRLGVDSIDKFNDWSIVYKPHDSIEVQSHLIFLLKLHS